MVTGIKGPSEQSQLHDATKTDPEMTLTLRSKIEGEQTNKPWSQLGTVIVINHYR
jgi:hypothetical protein